VELRKPTVGQSTENNKGVTFIKISGHYELSITLPRMLTAPATTCLDYSMNRGDGEVAALSRRPVL